MELPKALEIINTLSNGVDPGTGERFGNDSPYQHPEVVRALYLAHDALRRRADAAKRRKGLPENTGRRWSKDEDLQLKDRFAHGRRITELAADHCRTAGAVVARLVHLGCVNIDAMQTPAVSA